MAEAQLCVENATKAVISCFQVPSWSHDPSEELLSVVEEYQVKIAKLMGSKFLKQLQGLAEQVRVLAPEHGRAAYGMSKAESHLAHLHQKERAETALKYAGEARTVAKKFVSAWYAP